MAEQDGLRINAPWLAKAEVRRGSLSTKIMFQEVLLVQISNAEASDREES